MDADGPFELDELGTRRQADLVEHATSPLERPERVGLPSGAIERQHEESPPSLSKRLLADHHRQRGDTFPVTAAGDRHLGALLVNGSKHLLQSGPFVSSRGPVAELE